MSPEKRITWEYNPEGLSETQEQLHPLLFINDKNSEKLKALNQEQQAEFIKMLTDAIEELNKEHTRLLSLMGLATQLPAKRLIWEDNHLKITKVIISRLSRTGCIPSKAYIAEATGLTRKTVQEHMAQGDEHSIYADHQRHFTMMAPRVMDVVLHEAVLEHNMKAAKMYFDILEKMKGPDPLSIYNTQNNYIQINSTVIKQETISQLNPEQLKQIEEMVQLIVQKSVSEEDAE
jgi:hypothetical protein